MRILKRDLSDFFLTSAICVGLEFNAKERAVFKRAAELAERARGQLDMRFSGPDRDEMEVEGLDYELARLEHAAREFSTNSFWHVSQTKVRMRPFTIEGTGDERTPE